jgi:NADP-dependent 3-hydroxy acid dehydrogenase YdfG
LTRNISRERAVQVEKGMIISSNVQNKLAGTVAIVTGASSGIGEATAKQLAELGATVAVVARRGDRLTSLVAEIEAAGGSALAVTADITERVQAEHAVQTVIDRFGRLDILINNAGLMLLGSVLDQEVEEWERMIAVNQNGLLFMTKAVLPHLLAAAEDDLRGVADIVNISSIAGRQAWANFAAYNMTKFGVNGFTEALRQEVTKKHVRVGVLEPGAVETELISHNNDAVKDHLAVSDAENIPEKLQPEDIAESIAYMVTRHRRSSVAELWAMPTSQA